MIYDVAVIGAGITGTSIVYELSKYNLKVLLLESENDVSQRTTKANSGIIHAGYDPLPGTKMSRLNVEGSKKYKELAKSLNVHYEQIGSLVVGRLPDDLEKIQKLYNQGKEVGIEGLEILHKEKLHKLEPYLAEDLDIALLAPTAAIVSPWEMAIAMAETAVFNGTNLKLNNKVVSIDKVNNIFKIKTNEDIYEAKYVINCAGTHADEIYKMVLKGHEDECFTIVPTKGEYYLLDKNQSYLANRVIFQTPSKLGKGVLVSKTVHGNLIVGPNASIDVKHKDDTSNTAEVFDYVRKTSARSIPSINFRENIRNFAGVRATIKDYDDFLIEESPLVKNFINFAGIKSPGLSCAPSFGPEAVKILKDCGLTFVKKDKFTLVPLNKYFSEMTEEEKIAKIKEDKDYGQIICRCESVTLGEIKNAIHRIIPATTVDAIKRRTNSGMGRCQGGFCGPKIVEILQEELHKDATSIEQDKKGSYIIDSHTKGEQND